MNSCQHGQGRPCWPDMETDPVTRKIQSAGQVNTKLSEYSKLGTCNMPYNHLPGGIYHRDMHDT